MAFAEALREKAGVVAYRFVKGDEPHVLLITSRKYKGSWVFPVGAVKQGESLEAAAKRECAEEAGYCVDLRLKLPTIEAPDGETKIKFTFFLATVVGNAAQWETDRKRDWLPTSEVADALPTVFRPVALEAVQRLMQMSSD